MYKPFQTVIFAAAVFVVRDKSKLLPDLLKKCTVIEKNLNQIAASDFINDEYNAFYNLAWSGVSAENKNNVNLQLNNIAMSIHALEVSHELGCALFLSSGTVAEYSFCDDVMNVNDRQTPNDMYGAAKVSAHYFLEVRARQLEQPFIWTVILSRGKL